MTVRVLVVDDSPTMRAILMSRLSNEPDISVIGTAANAAEARELIKQLDPDVVTLDIEMPGMGAAGPARMLGSSPCSWPLKVCTSRARGFVGPDRRCACWRLGNGQTHGFRV